MRLIDADKLKAHYAWWGNEYASDELKERKRDFDTIIDLQPTLTFKTCGVELTEDEREHGEWRPIQIGKWHGFECTACKISRDVPCSNKGIPQWKYCPECGAKMMEDSV